MRRLCTSALAAVALFACLAMPGAGTAQRRAHAAVSDCGFIAFAPDSDDLAYGIRSTGVSCRTARGVASATAGEAFRPGADHTLQSGTFLCRGTFVQPVGKYYEHYVCRSSRVTVTFDRG
jgi:hypothetical protein